MYYPIGWPHKLTCNVHQNSSAPCTVPNIIEGITQPMESLKLNGDAINVSPKESNGHIPQSQETNPELTNGSCNQDTRILQVIANGDRSLLLVLTFNSLRLWYPKVSFLFLIILSIILFYSRLSKSLLIVEMMNLSNILERT